MNTRYTLVVGTKDWSSWSLRAYMALRATGAAFDEVFIPLRQQPLTGNEIRQHSKSGHVPILKIEENGRNVTVWDSLAICETLAERHPEAKLWPGDPFVRAEARSYSAEMHSGFPDVRDQLSMDFARRKPMPELRDETKAQLARIIDVLVVGAHALWQGWRFSVWRLFRRGLHVRTGRLALRRPMACNCRALSKIMWSG